MNSETIVLRMNAREADSLAYVLMTALRKVGMADRERKHTTEAANELFSLLGYDIQTDANGNRKES